MHIFLHFLVCVSLMILVLEVHLLKKNKKEQANEPHRFNPYKEKET